jgi:predicted anti-sigma-YlaC factor YlaD
MAFQRVKVMMKRLLALVMKPNPRECEHVRGLFSDYLDGEIDPAARRRVEEHVGFCRRCRRVLANLRHTLERVRELGESTEPNALDVGERVTRAWRERA